MTPDSLMLNESVLAMRREFDLSFVRAQKVDAAAQRLLAVHVGGDPYAIRFDEIGGLFVDRHVVPLPTSLPELLGLAGFRGQVVPVYDLAMLLGYSREALSRWLLLARFREPVALAFDSFDAHLAVGPEQIVTSVADGLQGAPHDGRAPRAHLSDAVRDENAVRPIIRLQSVMEEVQRRVGAIRSTKEG